MSSVPLSTADAPRHRLWPSALAAVLGLAYLAWAGSGADPRTADLWTYTSTRWFVPAPGLGHLWAAAAIVIASLSLIAYRAAKRESAGPPWSTLANVAILGIILIVALDVRLAVWRFWNPLPLDTAVISPRAFRPLALGSRGWAIAADMLALILLLLALKAKGRSYWPAALYAFHPVVIMQVAANGTPIAWWMPPLVLLAFGWRLQKWLRELLIMGAAAACTWWVAHLALQQTPFNGLLAECLGSLGWEDRHLALTLIIVEIVLQALVILLAARRGWNLAQTLGHVLVAWALVSPRVMPADLLPILVLLPLGWTRAGWVLGTAILALYAIVPLGVGHAPLRVPTWVIFLVMTPVAITALEEWAASLSHELKRRPAPPATTTPPNEAAAKPLT